MAMYAIIIVQAQPNNEKQRLVVVEVKSRPRRACGRAAGRARRVNQVPARRTSGAAFGAHLHNALLDVHVAFQTVERSLNCIVPRILAPLFAVRKLSAHARR